MVNRMGILIPLNGGAQIIIADHLSSNGIVLPCTLYQNNQNWIESLMIDCHSIDVKVGIFLSHSPFPLKGD